MAVALLKGSAFITGAASGYHPFFSNFPKFLLSEPNIDSKVKHKLIQFQESDKQQRSLSPNMASNS
jgi:hypothetical protein